MKAGRVIKIVTTGGGGRGDPLQREPELVRLEEIEVDVAATARRRGKSRDSRPPLEMFDRGSYFRSLAKAEEGA